MVKESNFEHDLIEEILELFPGAVVLKNDSSARQGIPDRLILFGKRWAAFEVKAHKTAKHQRNQDYYVALLNEMSFAAFVYPQNKEWFLNELQQTLRPRRRTRISVGV